MRESLQHIYADAVALLGRLSTSDGILASTIESDNYKRIWARDSIISGIAGLLTGEDTVINGFRASLLTLARHQNVSGIIPSNVKDGSAEDISYGSLVGRVDTNTWFIVGACLYYLNTGDESAWEALKPAIQKCRTYLKCIEFNGKGWIYTPISGNWADEYPIHGYTLYDNCLRLWGESLWTAINGVEDSRFMKLKAKTAINFWPIEGTEGDMIYQRSSFRKVSLEKLGHFCSFILPGIYDSRFDAAGNAFALLLFDLSFDQKNKLSNFLKGLKKEISNALIPAFWPPIHNHDQEWPYIEGNHAFDFKNKPYHFHNGGIWPVWMGWFCMGLARNEMNHIVDEVIADLIVVITRDHWNFQEYLSSDQLELGGKQEMGFTASGIVFMYHALMDESFKTKLGL
jgi:hypothetical protein